MSDPEISGPEEPPAFDREAARARYRKLMRSWPMRLSYLLLALTILFAWAWGVAAAIAPDVEHLSGHGINVPTQQCIICHTDSPGSPVVRDAPRMNHPAAPSCGFCHRQDVAEPSATGTGWARDPHQ